MPVSPQIPDAQSLADAAYSKAELIIAKARSAQTPVLRLADLKHLSRLPPLDGLAVTELSLSGTNLSDLTNVSQLTNLKKFDFHDARNLKNVYPLAELKDLEYLALFSMQEPIDLEPIGTLKSLQHLAIGWTPIADISPLAKLKQLTLLTLSKTNVSDFSPILELSSIRLACTRFG